jgi:hypothetical protein
VDHTISQGALPEANHPVRNDRQVCFSSLHSDAHHQIRYFVVKEMAIRQRPIEPEYISEELNLPKKGVNLLLEELERKLFFLVRNEMGAVVWAFPVTVEITPHRLSFSSGELLYAA